MTQARLGSRVWMNGAVIRTDQAFVPVTDRGLTLGDGLFETMLWTGERVRFFDDHMARLTASCGALGFTLPCAIFYIQAALNDLGTDADGAPAALRLTLTRGTGPRGLAIAENGPATLIASIAPITLLTSPRTLKTVSITRNANSPSSRFKTLSYIDNIMALQEARAAGGDDAIMPGTTGNVACTSSANLVLRYQGINLTPALDDGALPGIVRGRLIKAGLVEEARVGDHHLATCDAGAQTNALIGVRGIAQINGRSLAQDPNWLQSLLKAL